MNKFGATLLLGILCILTYSNSLHNPFLMDDHALILDNPHIGDLSHLQLNPFSSAPDGADGEHYIYFRPLTHLADYVSYLLYGRDVFGYHVMNLCLLFITAVLWWHFVQRLFPQGPTALIAGAFFVTHPIFGVLVNYTSTTGYILLILLTVAGFLFHWEYVNRRLTGLLIAAILCFCLSMLCHETAAGFPFYLAGILYFIKKFSLRRAAQHTLPYIAVIILYIIFRMNYASLKDGVIDNIGGFQLSPWHYTAMLVQLVWSYLKNLIGLQDIVLIFSAAGTNNPAAWNLAFALAAGSLIYMLFFRWRADPKGIFPWWLVVGFGPVTLACFSRPSMGLIISPHWLLIPSLGYCLFLALLFSDTINSTRRAVGIGVTAFVLIAFISVSRHYNRLWGNEILYCHYMLKLSPRIPLAKFWLAHAYASDGQWEPARRYFKETIMGVENDWKGFANLGVIEGELGNTEAEIDYYLKALRLEPDSPDLWNNLATVYIEQEDYDKARVILTRILRKYPGFTAAAENLRRLPPS